MSQIPLGQNSSYETQYNPKLLFPIMRQKNRDALKISANKLPFHGIDVWHAYEMSWLNSKGKPQNAIGRFTIPCDSPNLIESKSFKLYLNSFNNTRFEDWEKVDETLQRDLSECAGKTVGVEIFTIDSFMGEFYRQIGGYCLDELDVEIDQYQVNPQLLLTEATPVSEKLYSTLLKSNCLVTGQPDWGSIQIEYSGPQINHVSLLKYLISYRDHEEFHEQCVERIFNDILTVCHPTELTIVACYTRRGGLDINPVRSTDPTVRYDLSRCPRQ